MTKFLSKLSSNIVLYLSLFFVFVIVSLNILGTITFQKLFIFESIYEFIMILVAILIITIISIILFKIKYSNRFIVSLFLTAVIVRLLWIISINTLPASDFKIMYEAALELAKGNYEEVLNSYYLNTWVYQLGFTGYLALILKLFNNSLFMVKLINVIIVSLIPVVIYFSSKKLVCEKAARIPAILYALYIGSIVNTSVLTNQHLATLLFYIAILLILSNINRKFKWILVGMAIAIGQIIRPEGPIVLLAILLFLVFKDITNIKKVGKSLLEFIGILSIVFIISKIVSLGFINAGITNYQLSNRDPLWKLVCGLNHDTKGTYSEEDWEYLDGFGGLGKQREKAEIELIKNRLTEYKRLPITFAYKYVVMWGGNDTSLQLSFTDNIDNSTLYNIVLKLEKIQYIVISVMFMIGIINIIKRKEGFGKNHIYLIIFLGYLLAHLLIEVQPRYRYFALPIFFIISSYSLTGSKIKRSLIK